MDFPPRITTVEFRIQGIIRWGIDFKTLSDQTRERVDRIGRSLASADLQKYIFKIIRELIITKLNILIVAIDIHHPSWTPES